MTTTADILLDGHSTFELFKAWFATQQPPSRLELSTASPGLTVANQQDRAYRANISVYTSTSTHPVRVFESTATTTGIAIFRCIQKITHAYSLVEHLDEILLLDN